MGSQNQTSLMWDRWTVKLDYIVWYSKPCETFCILMLAGYPCRLWNFKLVFWLSNYLSVQCLKLSSVLTMRNNRLWKCIFVTIFNSLILYVKICTQYTYLDDFVLWACVHCKPAKKPIIYSPKRFCSSKNYIIKPNFNRFMWTI